MVVLLAATASNVERESLTERENFRFGVSMGFFLSAVVDEDSLGRRGEFLHLCTYRHMKVAHTANVFTTSPEVLHPMSSRSIA